MLYDVHSKPFSLLLSLSPLSLFCLSLASVELGFVYACMCFDFSCLRLPFRKRTNVKGAPTSSNRRQINLLRLALIGDWDRNWTVQPKLLQEFVRLWRNKRRHSPSRAPLLSSLHTTGNNVCYCQPHRGGARGRHRPGLQVRSE